MSMLIDTLKCLSIGAGPVLSNDVDLVSSVDRLGNRLLGSFFLADEQHLCYSVDQHFCYSVDRRFCYSVDQHFSYSAAATVCLLQCHRC